MLNVNSTSSASGGSGSTTIASTASSSNGAPTPRCSSSAQRRYRRAAGALLSASSAMYLCRSNSRARRRRQITGARGRDTASQIAAPGAHSCGTSTLGAAASGRRSGAPCAADRRTSAPWRPRRTAASESRSPSSQLRVQRPRQRRCLDDRRPCAPLRSRGCAAAIRSRPLATTIGALHALVVVAQRHREVGRVRDHHVRLRHLLHHAFARRRLLRAPHASLDLRAAFGLLVLVADLLACHAHRFVDTARSPAARRSTQSTPARRRARSVRRR